MTNDDMPKVGEVWKYNYYRCPDVEVYAIERRLDACVHVLWEEDDKMCNAMHSMKWFMLNFIKIRNADGTPAIRLEPGKLYRTRDGRKAFCLRTGNHEYEAKLRLAWIAIQATKDINVIYENGHVNLDCSPMCYDIISEWKDKDDE